MMYEVGKQFPVNNLADGKEKCIASFHEKFLDLQIYVIPQSGDIKAMKSGPIRYGIFEYKNIPFFLIDFIKTFSFDAPLNFLNTQDDKQDDWLNEEANLMTIYCIHALTNELLAMRAIGLQRDFCEGLRDILEKQLNQYQDASEINKNIDMAIQKYNTNIMIANAKMIRL